MKRTSAAKHLIIPASVGKHLALAPVAFAVTEGSTHTVVYANTTFRRLQSAGAIYIGRRIARKRRAATDLPPLLDRVFESSQTVRDEVLSPLGAAPSGPCRTLATLPKSS